jgi:hypothetical protein
MTRNYRVLIAAIAIVLGSVGRRTAAQAPTEQPRPLSTTNIYTFLIGSGFLCEPGDISICPATVRGDSGDSYEMTGAGVFDTQSKSVKVTGTYTHKSPNGNVLETGVWIGTELMSFVSYGAAPNALPRNGVAFSPAAWGPKRLAMPPGPMPTGGLAIFRMRLLPMQSTSTTAVLQANCALGDVPGERSVEGIRLSLERNNSEYSEELSGRVMFLAMRPEVSTPVKTQHQETAPETSERPPNGQQ